MTFDLQELMGFKSIFSILTYKESIICQSNDYQDSQSNDYQNIQGDNLVVSKALSRGSKEFKTLITRKKS